MQITTIHVFWLVYAAFSSRLLGEVLWWLYKQLYWDPTLCWNFLLTCWLLYAWFHRRKWPMSQKRLYADFWFLSFTCLLWQELLNQTTFPKIRFLFFSFATKDIGPSLINCWIRVCCSSSFLHLNGNSLLMLSFLTQSRANSWICSVVSVLTSCNYTSSKEIKKFYDKWYTF